MTAIASVFQPPFDFPYTAFYYGNGSVLFSML